MFLHGAFFKIVIRNTYFGNIIGELFPGQSRSEEEFFQITICILCVAWKTEMCFLATVKASKIKISRLLRSNGI